MEHWAEIPRLSLSEHLGVKTNARRLGLARNTVRSALASEVRYVPSGNGRSPRFFPQPVRSAMEP